LPPPLLLVSAPPRVPPRLLLLGVLRAVLLLLVVASEADAPSLACGVVKGCVFVGRAQVRVCFLRPRSNAVTATASTANSGKTLTRLRTIHRRCASKYSTWCDTPVAAACAALQCLLHRPTSREIMFLVLVVKGMKIANGSAVK
jgi:hypothetical protein